MNSYVCGFFFNSAKDQVLLVLKAKPDWQKGKLNGIGGMVEFEEHPIEAMVREFKEETGITTKSDDWNLKVVLTGPESSWKVYFYSSVCYSCRNLEMLLTEEVRTKEVEPIYPVDLPLLPLVNKIDNLNWLIPLCLSKTEEFPIFIRDTTK